MQPAHIEFAQRITAAQTKDSAWSLLMRELDQRGFALAKYGFAPIMREDWIDHVLELGSFRPEWERFYTEGNYMPDDYVAQHLLFKDEPLSFELLYDKIDEGEITGRVAYGHLVGLDMGLRNGFAVPLRDRGGLSRGGISMASKTELTVKEFNAHIAANGAEIVQLVNTFHQMLHRPLLLSDEQHPSRREQECLLWTTRGLRTKQIADKLGTHAKTVEKQLASARQKLNARNNTEAAVKAIVLGLITP